MARSIWTGSISFGLVSVPVRLFTATESKELRFHFLDRRDLTPIGYDKVSKETGKHVDADEVVRGFEFAKGRFVELSDEDIDRLDIELTHSIDICDFVSIDEIDPIYFRKAYYLLPQDGAEKAYRLLLRALDETGRVAIAKIVIRNKQHLACVRPVGKTLVLETMYYADEVRKPEDAPAPQVRPAEVEMAKTLIENLAAKWDPRRYHDNYRNALLDLLEKKAEGEPLPEPKEAEGGEVVDLMDALRQSVARNEAEAEAAEAGRDTRRRSTGRARSVKLRRCRSPNTSASATRSRPRSPSAAASAARSRSSSSSAMTRPACTTTSGWRRTERWRRGRCRRACRSSPARRRSRCTSRITRSSTRPSTVRFRRASTAPGASRSGTTARTSCSRRSATGSSPCACTASGSEGRGRSSPRTWTGRSRTGC